MSNLDSYTTDHDFYEVFYSRPEEWPNGETALIAGVLEDVIDIIRKGPADRKRYMEALNWLTDKRSDGMFTFANICSILRLDSSVVRAKLLQAPEPKPKPKRNRVTVYCRCGCRGPGRWRNVCRPVYDEAFHGAGGRPSDEQLMRVLERRVKGKAL